MREVSEKSWGLWPVPHQCPSCGAPVAVFRRPTDADARRLVSIVTGLARLTNLSESLADFLRGRCTTPEEVDRLLSSFDRLNWDAWHAEFERYLSNASTAEWNRRNLELWPEAIRARDDGSLRRTVEAAAAKVKEEKRADVARWRTAFEERKRAATPAESAPDG